MIQKFLTLILVSGALINSGTMSKACATQLHVFDDVTSLSLRHIPGNLTIVGSPITERVTLIVKEHHPNVNFYNSLRFKVCEKHMDLQCTLNLMTPEEYQLAVYGSLLKTNGYMGSSYPATYTPQDGITYICEDVYYTTGSSVQTLCTERQIPDICITVPSATQLSISTAFRGMLEIRGTLIKPVWIDLYGHTYLSPVSQQAPGMSIRHPPEIKPFCIQDSYGNRFTENSHEGMTDELFEMIKSLHKWDRASPAQKAALEIPFPQHKQMFSEIRYGAYPPQS